MSKFILGFWGIAGACLLWTAPMQTAQARDRMFANTCTGIYEIDLRLSPSPTPTTHTLISGPLRGTGPALYARAKGDMQVVNAETLMISQCDVATPTLKQVLLVDIASGDRTVFLEGRYFDSFAVGVNNNIYYAETTGIMSMDLDTKTTTCVSDNTSEASGTPYEEIHSLQFASDGMLYGVGAFTPPHVLNPITNRYPNFGYRAYQIDPATGTRVLVISNTGYSDPTLWPRCVVRNPAGVLWVTTFIEGNSYNFWRYDMVNHTNLSVNGGLEGYDSNWWDCVCDSSNKVYASDFASDTVGILEADILFGSGCVVTFDDDRPTVITQFTDTELGKTDEDSIGWGPQDLAVGPVPNASEKEWRNYR